MFNGVSASGCEDPSDWRDHDNNVMNGIVQNKPKTDRKDVLGKPLPLLMPYCCLEAYSKVSDDGFQKYKDRCSWMNNTNGVEVYSNAAARHLFKSTTEVIDPESGLPHLYAALWSICSAIWHHEND